MLKGTYKFEPWVDIIQTTRKRSMVVNMQAQPRIEVLLDEVIKKKASDLHITGWVSAYDSSRWSTFAR